MDLQRMTSAGAHALSATALAALLGLAPPSNAAEGPKEAVAADGATAQHAADRAEWHIRELHDRLKITPAEEPLWDKAAAAMRANDQKIDALVSERHDKAATMTAIEDLRSFAAITEAHAAGTRDFIPAFETLYQSMPADQQANADQVFRKADSRSHRKANHK